MASTNLNVIPKIFPVRDLQRDYPAILRLVNTKKTPVLLIKKSTPEAVILDIETYNSLVCDDYEYDEEYILKMDKKAEKEYKQGKTKKLRSLKDLV